MEPNSATISQLINALAALSSKCMRQKSADCGGTRSISRLQLRHREPDWFHVHLNHLEAAEWCKPQNRCPGRLCRQQGSHSPRSR